MVKTQNFGGYILDATHSLLDVGNESRLQQLLKNLSHFDRTSIIQNETEELDTDSISPFLVFYNLIQRGLPTRMSFRLETLFDEAFNAFELVEYLGGDSYTYKNATTALRESLDRALHIIDPRVQSSDLREDYIYSWEQLDSEYEEDFFFNTLGELAGDTSWLLQLVECQRPLTEIVKSSIKNKKLESNFIEQRCDFSLEFPHLVQGKKGVILEVDGSQHKAKPQKRLDEARDKAARESSWFNTIRIPTQQWSDQNQLLSDLRDILQDPYFKKINQNYQTPLYSSPDGLTALQLALSPILISRVQKALLGQIIDGNLDLKKKKWNICIIERDIPGGSLAIRDLEDSLKHFSSLIENEFKLPTLELQIFSSEEFLNAQIHSVSEEQPSLISELSASDIKYDLVIDISVLSRIQTWPIHNFKRSARNYVVITSSQSVKDKRRFKTGKLIQFNNLTTQADNGDYVEDEILKNHLEVFLIDIFRKKSFRPGQLPILNRALRQESVIGLLPTGGGKSMTYQLSTFMQPGITIIVDPIKSLMRDQVSSISGNRIDCAGFVNSSLNREEKEKAHENLIIGDLLFFFMSPERLLIPEFRGILESTYDNDNFFSYCVIDEAHCVSEWGHDFRTSYLFLGRNATLYAKTQSGDSITLFGLTATASYDVLADIQRELSGDIHNKDSILSDDAVIRFETFNRPELQYEVKEVNIQADNPYRDDWEVKKALGAAKHSTIVDLLSTMPSRIADLNLDPEVVYLPITDTEISDDKIEEICQSIGIQNYNPDYFWREDNTNAGIVFCPHRTWLFGVTDKYKVDRHSGIADTIESILPHPNIKIGTFLGVDQDSSSQSEQETDNQNNQDAFINSELNLMVCTKAFGMGIDKSNVRISIHLNYPQSIESYVQEAGRIGRDGKIALSCIVYNNQDFIIDNPTANGSRYNYDRQLLNDFYNKSFPGEMKEKWNLTEILRGIESPARGAVREIVSAIHKEKELDLHVDIKQNRQRTSNYLLVRDSDYQSYGILFLNSLDPRTNYSDYPSDESLLVLNIVRSTIQELIPADTDPITWLSQINSTERDPGIEELLEEMEFGEDKQFTLFFTNDVTKYQNEVHQILSRIVDNNINKFFKDYKATSSIEGFLRTIPDIADEDAQAITKYFYKSRTKHDTEKALYRLALVGVVKDFTTDYLHGTFQVTIVKQSDEEYANVLHSYIRRYYSESRTQKILGGISDRPGENYIQKALNFIIEFLYIEIAQKRKKAIDAIQEACEVGATQGNRAIKEYIDVYFNSKYGRSGFTYEVEGEIKDGSLLDRTKEGRESSIKFVWEFIHIATEWDTSGAQLVNMKHLRGACIRFLTSNPNNASLLLLKAFCTLVLEEERISVSKLIIDARSEIKRGFDILREEGNTSMVDIIVSIEHYFDLLEGNSSRIELKELIQETRELQILHSNRNWLQTFNKNFMVNYE